MNKHKGRTRGERGQFSAGAELRVGEEYEGMEDSFSGVNRHLFAPASRCPPRLSVARPGNQISLSLYLSCSFVFGEKNDAGRPRPSFDFDFLVSA